MVFIDLEVVSERNRIEVRVHHQTRWLGWRYTAFSIAEFQELMEKGPSALQRAEAIAVALRENEKDTR